MPQTRSRWKRLLATLACAATLTGVGLVSAAPAHAIDTGFTTTNTTDQPLTLIGKTGNYLTQPTSVAAGGSNNYRVIFYLGQNNTATSTYNLGTTGYRVYLAAVPGYGSWAPTLTCTIRNTQGVILPAAPYACAVQGTTVRVAKASWNYTLANETPARIEPIKSSGTFLPAPSGVNSLDTTTLSHFGSQPSTVSYGVGSFLQVDIALNGGANATCTIRKNGLALPNGTHGYGCFVDGTTITFRQANFTVVNQTPEELRFYAGFSPYMQNPYQTQRVWLHYLSPSGDKGEFVNWAFLGDTHDYASFEIGSDLLLKSCAMQNTDGPVTNPPFVCNSRGSVAVLEPANIIN